MRRFRNNKPNYVIFTLSRDISEILLKCPFVHKVSKVLYHNSNSGGIGVAFGKVSFVLKETGHINGWQLVPGTKTCSQHVALLREASFFCKGQIRRHVFSPVTNAAPID